MASTRRELVTLGSNMNRYVYTVRFELPAQHNHKTLTCEPATTVTWHEAVRESPDCVALRVYGSASIWANATRAWCAVSASTVISLTTRPATSSSSAHTRWGRSMRFIVEQ